MAGDEREGSQGSPVLCDSHYPSTALRQSLDERTLHPTCTLSGSQSALSAARALNVRKTSGGLRVGPEPVGSGGREGCEFLCRHVKLVASGPRAC